MSKSIFRCSLAWAGTFTSSHFVAWTPETRNVHVQAGDLVPSPYPPGSLGREARKLSLECRHPPGDLAVLRCFLNSHMVQERGLGQVEANTWVIPEYTREDPSKNENCLLEGRPFVVQASSLGECSRSPLASVDQLVL